MFEMSANAEYEAVKLHEDAARGDVEMKNNETAQCYAAVQHASQVTNHEMALSYALVNLRSEAEAALLTKDQTIFAMSQQTHSYLQACTELAAESAGLKEAYGTLKVEYEKNVAAAKEKSDKLEDTIGQSELHFTS